MIVGFYYLNFGPLIWKNGIAEFKNARRAAAVARAARNAAASGLMASAKATITLRDIVRGVADDVRDEGQLPKWLMFILSFVFLLRSTDLMYYGAYVAFTILGNAFHPYFFAFHLVDIVVRYKELAIVLQAVVKPAKSLALTFVLFWFIEYFFAIFGFVFLRSEYGTSSTGFDPDGECTSLFVCLITGFDQGFKNNGGIGPFLGPAPHSEGGVWYGRILFDNSYNLILMVRV